MWKVGQLKEFPRTKYGRIIIDFTIITFVAVAIFRKLFLSSEWPAGGDVLGWISRAYLFGKDFRWLFVWRPHSFGFVEGINSMDFFLMLIHFVCQDASTTIKIFMFSSFLMAGFSMYAFAYRYTRRHLAALSASLVYTLNQWLFSQFTEAHIDIIFSYALAPLLFLLLDKALETRKFRDVIALALALSVFVAGFHPECILIYGMFLIIFVFFYVVIPTRSPNFRTRIGNLVKISLPAGVICFLLAAFSLVPFLLNVRAPYYSPSFTRPLEEAYVPYWSYVNITDAFTLRGLETGGYLWVVEIPGGLSLPDFPISSFLLCLFFLAYCTIFFRRDRYTAFFATSTLVSVMLSKGPFLAFGYTYVWAWFNVPHFTAFRTASRWIMMAAFSHAFFVSVLAHIIANYIQKRRHLQINEVILTAKTKISERTRAKELYVSLDVLNVIVRRFHKFLYYVSVAIMISIFLSGFVSSWFFFSQGLQVYTPPRNYIEAYEWIGKQPGDYKVVTIGRSADEWESKPGAESDFCYSYMLTDLGWGHDVGYDSPFIHDKPTLQDGGWDPSSRTFVDHLRFQLVRHYMTDDFLKLVGTLNYKYVVLPPYTSASVRDFFLKQQGVQVVRNQSSIVVENAFHTSRLFASTEHVVVVGGLDSFSSICKIDNINLNTTALIFAHQIDRPFILGDALFGGSKALIFVNSDILDLIMLSLKNDINLIHVVDYGVPSRDPMKYWVRWPSWRIVGRLVLGVETLTTLGKNSVSIPFRVESNGIYDMWMRIGFLTNRGNLSISVDGVPSGEIRPYSDYWSRQMWVNITRLDLISGDHSITLTNDGTGYNDVDAIAIVKPSLFQSRADEVLHALQAFHGRLIHVLEAESAFTYNLPAGWSVAHSPYNGFVLHTEGIGSNISPEGKASASSVGTWYNVSYEAHGANDGMLNTRWASKPPEMPQWLQIEWATPQELVGVHILFERAFAKDYVIQTWNGANWVDQVNVTGNTLLERSHYFPPVQTTKLRIYVTSAPAYDLVSIWELEAYTTPWVSTKVSIPREGRCMLALRLASGPDYGTLNLRVNDFTAIISCNSSISEFKWYEVGPVYLQAGDQTIVVGGMGKIEFDQMIIYSLTDGEDALSVNDLFKPSSAPYVSYERINPCEYKVHIKNSEGPFLLVFSESYHPMWRAYIGDVEVAPIMAYSLVNGFFINQTGDFDITLYFTGQTYANLGLKISTITLIGVVAYLTIQPVISRVRKKRKAEVPRVADKPS